MGNMYFDSVYQWNVVKGCLHNCIYCAYRIQAYRQMHNCNNCYEFIPHFHEERLNINFSLDRYKTEGDQFIWVASSSDIYFAKKEWMYKILERVKLFPNRTFFFQTKNPLVFFDYNFPSNCWLGITLETNKEDIDFKRKISNAPLRFRRYWDFKELYCSKNKKIITIEPILQFDLDLFVERLKEIKPYIIYLGFDSHKKKLPEPSIEKTMQLVEELRKFTKVKLKYMKGVIV